MSISRHPLLLFVFGISLICSANALRAADTNTFKVGPFTKIYDPSIGEKEKWYINDHCFAQAQDGAWHMFGITHKEPMDPLNEVFFAHATAPTLTGSWTRQSPVLQADRAIGESLVWAPCIVHERGLYWMFYCAGGPSHDQYRLDVATSKDLWTWERHPANPVVVDGYDARDPMVMRVNGKWVLYYCATSTPKGGNHCVLARTSDDLIHWSDKQIVFLHFRKGTTGGPTESPYVVEHGGKYYLFVCTNSPYDDTAVYESSFPFHWDIADKVGSFPAHAAEVTQTPDGKWYVSRAGWGRGGLYLAPLTWNH